MAWPSCSRARAVLALAVCGLLFHGLATMCMFDLYFRSPVVHGMAPHASTHTPPARRLVLFVGAPRPAYVFSAIANPNGH